MSPTAEGLVLRSIIETPVLNQRYVARLPSVAADAVMLDTEDSVAPSNKAAAREAIERFLGSPPEGSPSTVIVRCNNLDTPWGGDDLAVLARAGAQIISYPKISSVDELGAVEEILERHGSQAGLHVMIETAAAVRDVELLAGGERVVGLHFGYVDYAADLGVEPFDGTWLDERVYAYPRGRIANAARAADVFLTGGTLVPDLHDMEQVRHAADSWRSCGFTACIGLLPSHIDVINQAFSPSPEAVESALALCLAFEEAQQRGEPVAHHLGRIVTRPDYLVAKRLTS